MQYQYPLDRSNDRQIQADYDGPVLIWDIDKTYLNTHFSTWRGLLAIPFEFALDKEPIPGAVQLLHGLRHGPDAGSRLTPLYFVSASPPQLRRVLQRRMVMDGVDFDGISFKDQVYLLKKRQLAKLRDQTGYKLTALLLYRRELPEHCRYLMFGDDAEDDATIFALFEEICAGLREDPLHRRLADRGTPEEDCKNVCKLARDLPRQSVVEQIYIHRIRRRPLEQYERFEGLVIPTDSFLEQALHLAHTGHLRPSDAGRVGQALLTRGVDEEQLAETLVATQERFELEDALVDQVRTALG